MAPAVRAVNDRIESENDVWKETPPELGVLLSPIQRVDVDNGHPDSLHG